jgi:hypothetical protein
MNMPPYTRLRLDDCTGIWRDAKDLAFVDVLNAHGIVPSLFVCLDALSESGARTMRALASAGKAEFAPHVLRPNVGPFLGDGAHDYSASELRAHFRSIDDHFAQWGVPIAPVIADHNHEFSPLAVPEFIARGMRYRINVTAPGERWEAAHRDWRPAPYGLTSYAIDEIPGTGIIAVLNHFTPFMDARTPVGHREFIFDRDGSFGDVVWDFLNGLAGPDRVDLPGAAKRLALHERRGVESGFVGGPISHSHWMCYLSASQLDHLLNLVEAENGQVERRPVSASEACRRADDHRRIRLEDVRITGRQIVARIRGEAARPPELHLFDGADGSMTATWLTPAVDQENGEMVARLDLGRP